MKNVIPGKAIAFVLTFAFCLLTSVRPANSYIYGEEAVTRQLIVDKLIKTTAISDWQDNLPASQIVLKEGDVVEFEIKVKNTGDQELKNINVADYLPSYLKFIFGPATPNDSQELTWKIEKLDPGQEENFKIRTQIEGSNQVASDGTFCLMNKARAEAETGEADEDTASFCIVGAKKLPKAGSHNLALGTLIASLIGATGILLRKFGRGEILA